MKGRSRERDGLTLSLMWVSRAWWIWTKHSPPSASFSHLENVQTALTKSMFFFLFSNNFKSFLTMGLPLQVITYIKQNRTKAAWKDAGEHEVPLPGASWNFHTPPSLKAPRNPENTVLNSLKAALGGLF